MLKKSIMSIVSALFLVVTFSSSSSANEVNLGGFQGNVSTIVTHGFSVRTESNNCFLVSGSQATISTALQSLIGGNPHEGNGGCNYKRKDSYGNTAGKVVDVGSVLADDGRLNFDSGDVVDAGQSIALSFTGTNPDGVKLNLSGLAFMNPVLDLNDAAFKALTGDAKEHLEEDSEMAGIRGLTNDYSIKNIDDLHLKVIFQELKAFDKELDVHSNIENKILFPRALKLEKDVSDKIRNISFLN